MGNPIGIRAALNESALTPSTREYLIMLLDAVAEGENLVSAKLMTQMVSSAEKFEQEEGK